MSHRQIQMPPLHKPIANHKVLQCASVSVKHRAVNHLHKGSSLPVGFDVSALRKDDIQYQLQIIYIRIWRAIFKRHRFLINSFYVWPKRRAGAGVGVDMTFFLALCHEPGCMSHEPWAMSLLNVLMNNNNDSWIKFILFSKLQSVKSFKTSHFQQDCYQKQRNGKTHMSGVFKIWVSLLSPHDMFTNYFRSDDCASMWLQRSVDGDSWILWNQLTRINVPECNTIRCLSLMLQCSLPPMAQGC